MRIIAGKFKGRKLVYPKIQNVRPTQDKVREAIFAAINDYVSGAKVLDLFAGSGSFGVEAISRGCESVTFIDIEPKSVAAIRKNVKSLEAEDISKIFRVDYEKALKKLHQNNSVFDIVFLDPPYYKDIPKKALLIMSQYAILSPNNIIIIEHYKKDNIPNKIGNIYLIKNKVYGDTVVSFYTMETE